MSKEKTTPTLDEYITLLIKAKRLKALDKSRNRTSIRIPIIPNQESEEHWKRRLMLDIDQAETYLSRAMAEGNNEDAGYWKDMLEELLKQEEQGLPVMVQGANCMYIAGDCYGLNIPGNQTFAAKHKEKGFKRIDSSNMEPGDIVQDVGDGVPTHAMIFDSKDKNGKPLYNYARGFYSGIFNEDYVKQGHYPMIEDPLVYRYVGTPADSTQWINLYKLIYGLGKGGIIGVPYLKKGGEINKIKLIPKGQSGWTAYLNPKNWGVKDYVTDNFSQAFNLAEADGEKEFLWRGDRYAVKRVDPKSFNEQLEWFKNYINNYKLQDVLLDFFDSIKVDKLIGKELDRIFKQLDSLYTNFDWDKGDIEEYDNLSRFLTQEYDRISNNKDAYYDNYRKLKLDSVLYKLNNLKLDRFILTTKSNFKNGTVGYYNPKVDSLYATEDSGTFVHELTHATGADRLKNLQPTLKAMKKDLKNTGDLEFVLYLSTPNEMGARYILNLFLKHLNLPLNEYFVDKDLKKVE